MLCKYYSLDECYERDFVFEYLDELVGESLVSYEVYPDDVIKIKDCGLSDKKMKEILNFLRDNDVIDYSEYMTHSDIDPDEEDEDDYTNWSDGNIF